MSKKLLMSLAFLFYLFARSSQLVAQPSVTTLFEMEALPFDQFGALNKTYQVSEAEQLEWNHVQRSFVDTFVTSEVARELSRYAQKQMESYIYTPGRETELKLFGANETHVVYEVTLDELPSHSRIVERHLKLFVVGLRYDGKFLPNHFYLTIRGERFE